MENQLKKKNFDCDKMFENFRCTIPIEIINDTTYEKSEEFYVELDDPIWTDEEDSSKNKNGGPILSENNRCKIVIQQDEVLKVKTVLFKMFY